MLQCSGCILGSMQPDQELITHKTTSLLMASLMHCVSKALAAVTARDLDHLLRVGLFTALPLLHMQRSFGLYKNAQGQS